MAAPTAGMRAVVVGGAGGIGRATCAALLEQGFRVAIADLKLDVASDAAHDLDPGGERAFAVPVDITSRDSVDAMIGTCVAQFGGIDALVNLAGITKPAPSAEVPDEDWNAMLDVHLGGTFRCARAAFPVLKESPAAAIVSTASIAGQLGLPKRASYCAAKAAIEGLTRALAVEWAPFGIRVNAIAPGYVRTPPVERMIERGYVDADRLRKRIPLDRLAEPTEIGSSIAFLVSPAASYITGQTLVVDGGLMISGDF